MGPAVEKEDAVKIRRFSQLKKPNSEDWVRLAAVDGRAVVEGKQ
jgi:hypothetical protein